MFALAGRAQAQPQGAMIVTSGMAVPTPRLGRPTNCRLLMASFRWHILTTIRTLAHLLIDTAFGIVST